MYHYTYQITNLINNKIYYGVRSCKCLPENDNYWGSGLAIGRAIKKYGKDNFTKEIDKTFETKDEAYLYEAEIVNEEWVENRNTYNLGLGGCGGKLYIGENPFYGKTHTLESRHKMSESHKGKVFSEETIKKMSRFTGEKSWNYGRKPSDATKKKISQSNKGKTLSDITKKRMSEARMGEKNPFYGKTHTEQSLQKISEACKGKKQNQETIQKRIDAIVKNWLVISPECIEYNICNLAEFCRKYNLRVDCMSMVASGKRKHHQGWTCKKLD